MRVFVFDWRFETPWMILVLLREFFPEIEGSREQCFTDIDTLLEAVREEKPDLVVTNIPTFETYGEELACLRGRGIRVVDLDTGSAEKLLASIEGRLALALAQMTGPKCAVFTSKGMIT